MKFRLQVASDITKEYCESLELKTFQFRNRKQKRNPDFGCNFFVC